MATPDSLSHPNFDHSNCLASDNSEIGCVEITLLNVLPWQTVQYQFWPNGPSIKCWQKTYSFLSLSPVPGSWSRPTPGSLGWSLSFQRSPLPWIKNQKIVFRGPRYIKVKVSSSYFSASSWSSFCMIPSMLRMSSSRLSSFPAQKYGNKFLMSQKNLQTKEHSHLFLEFWRSAFVAVSLLGLLTFIVFTL